RILRQLARGLWWDDNPRRYLAEQSWQWAAHYNETTAALPSGLLHTRALQHWREHPTDLAIVAPDAELTFDELFRHAFAVAQLLQERGVGGKEFVAVVMDRGWEQVVAVFAILLAGAAYMPISATWPDHRIGFLLADGGVRIALTQSGIDAGIEWPEGVSRVC